MNTRMVIAGSVALVAGSAAYAGDPYAEPRRLVTLGPMLKPVNEPKVAAHQEDRMVVVWDEQDPPGQNETEAPVAVGYAVWDAVNQVWGERGTLVPPNGSDAQASPFVVIGGTLSTTNEFIGGAISFNAQEQPTPFVWYMEFDSDDFATRFHHFSSCEVDYPEIGLAFTAVDGETIVRTTLLVRNLVDVGFCGDPEQIGMRYSWEDTFDVIVVYTGTNHPTGGFSMQGPDITNEAIFEVRVRHP